MWLFVVITIVGIVSAKPTTDPTDQPTTEPTAQPTTEPTAQPTAQTTAQPQDDPQYTPCDHITGLTGQMVPMTGNTVRLCEKDGQGRGVYMVLFDWDLRIPLATQTHLNHNQIQTPSPGRSSASFRPSPLIDGQYQAEVLDYHSINSRTPNYETSTGTLQLDTTWSNNKNTRTPIHQGHLAADQYIKDSAQKDATYRYTNAVPQFGTFNSGAWCQHEILIKSWATEHCTDIKSVGNTWDMYIATGAVPSSGASARWFGRYGFGVSKDQASSIKYDGGTPDTASPYRINVPSSMWTAVCCIERDTQDNIVSYKNTAFSGKNLPDGCGTMTVGVATALPGQPRPFPSIQQCTQAGFYSTVKVGPSTQARGNRKRVANQRQSIRTTKNQRTNMRKATIQARGTGRG